jgi:hypothetical protein
MNKTAFVISIVLTTFVLMAVAGIAYALNESQRAAAAALQATISTPVSTVADPTAQPTTDTSVQDAINQREAAYQALIAQANARLAQAQQQEQALQAQLNAIQSASASATQVATASQPALTTDQAIAIASKFVRQTSVYSIETVSYQGAQVYMITFSSGDIVYVGMDGTIIGSVSAQQQNAQVSQRASGGGSRFSGGEGEHDDHEGGDH